MPVRRVVVDHVSFGVSDLPRSIEFYTRALAPLGFTPMGPWREDAHEVAFGVDDLDDFAVSLDYPPAPGVHVCFATTGRPGRGPNTRRGTTARSSWTPTATTSRRCTTGS